MEKLTIGSPIYEDDTIQTGPYGRVLFEGETGYKVVIHKNSEFTVDVEHPEMTMLELIKGKIHTVWECKGDRICMQKSPGGHLTVRGTEYILTSERGTNVIDLKEGTLDVTNLVTDETRFVTAGITVTIDSETIKLEALTEDRWNALAEDLPTSTEEETERETMVSEMQEKSDNGGGCLIATATFGSELAPQVQQLRELRDNSLLQTESGSTFMSGFNEFYYSFSPTIADWERENPVFKEVVKLTITPLITSLSILNYVDIDSESEMLGYGISLILLNIGMYFVAPALVIIHLKKRF